jgi:transposase-like protein
MKSLISKRRSLGATCGQCHSPDYTMHPPDEGMNRPWFKCNGCERTWTNEITGGVYAYLAYDLQAQQGTI